MIKCNDFYLFLILVHQEKMVKMKVRNVALATNLHYIYLFFTLIQLLFIL